MPTGMQAIMSVVVDRVSKGQEHTLAASQGVQASEAAVCQPSRVVASSVSDATRSGATAATLHATNPAPRDTTC